MSFTIRQLRYFVVAAEVGQISQAGKDLYISQSAITMAIKEIELHLGQEVFVRNSRGVSLTEAGRLFLPKAKQILQILTEANQLNLPDREVEGVVRLGVSPTVMGFFLPYHIYQLNHVYPKLTITIHELDRMSIERKLIAGELDFGLLLTSNLHQTSLRFETFISSIRRLWVSGNHELLKHDKPTFLDLQDHPYILLTMDDNERSTMNFWGNMRPQIKYRTSSVEAIRSMVAHGAGISILPDMMYRPWSLEGKRIETITLQQPIPALEVGMVWKDGLENNEVNTKFYDYFHGIFSTPLSTKSYSGSIF